MPAPQSSFREGGNPEGKGGTNHTQTPPPVSTSDFHTLVCRHQPAPAIGTKACPGLRSGIRGTSQTDESRSPKGPATPSPTARRSPSPGERAGVRVKAGGGRHQPHPNTCTSQHLGFSHPGVPAPAGTSDWHESMSRTPIRDVPSNQPPGETCRIRRPMVDGGMSKCSAGACQSLGVGRQNPPQFAVPNHNSGFSHLWCAGTSRHPNGTKACPGLRSGIRGTSQTDESRSYRRDP